MYTDTHTHRNTDGQTDGHEYSIVAIATITIFSPYFYLILRTLFQVLEMSPHVPGFSTVIFDKESYSVEYVEHNYSCGLSTATIEYSSLSAFLSVSVCLCVCLSVYTITIK